MKAMRKNNVPTIWETPAMKILQHMINIKEKEM